MQQCPYCGEEYIRLTANHLKTHGIDYIQYLKEYEPEEYYFKFVAEKLMELFRPDTDKFIEQRYKFNEGTFEWQTIHAKFNKGRIIKHLKKEATYGVMPYEKLTYFLVFDIDEKNTDILYSLYRALIEIGISDDEQLLSFSGTKGYHIAIFFSECIDKKTVQRLFDLVLSRAGLLDSNKRANGKPIIESRGTNNNGVKLPLSINYNGLKVLQKSGFNMKAEEERRFCYLVNYRGERIDTIDKMQSISKIERKRIYDILKKYSRQVVRKEYEIIFNEIGETKEADVEGVITDTGFGNYASVDAIEEIEKIVCKIDIVSFSKKEEDVISSIKSLLEKPIQPGVRHSTLLRIAIYYKHIGKSADENKKLLIEFSSHKKHKFRASMEENVGEIERMIHTIYFSETAYKYRINVGFKDLWFSREEILEILSVSKAIRKLYFAMYVHFKLYGDRQSNNFYMTYQTICTLTRMNNKKISEGITELESLGKITIVRRGKMDDSTEKHKLPNIYQMAYKASDKILTEDDKYYLLGKEGKIDNVIYTNFKMMCAKKFSQEEIKNYFKGERDVVKYKYQSLKRVS